LEKELERKITIFLKGILIQNFFFKEFSQRDAKSNLLFKIFAGTKSLKKPQRNEVFTPGSTQS